MFFGMEDLHAEDGETLARFEAMVRKLRFKGTQEMPVEVAAMGLAGEAGEVVDLLKKAVWHGKELSLQELTKELGDCAWYLCAIGQRYGISLTDIMAANVAKLEARYPGGQFVEGGGIRK